MVRYRKVCYMTLKPRRGLENPDVVAKQCLVGECETCTRRYIGKGWNGMFHGQDMWANEYSICFTATIEELLDYGKYEIPVVVEVDDECNIMMSDGRSNPCPHRPHHTFEDCIPGYGGHGDCPKYNYQHREETKNKMTDISVGEL